MKTNVTIIILENVTIIKGYVTALIFNKSIFNTILSGSVIGTISQTAKIVLKSQLGFYMLHNNKAVLIKIQSFSAQTACFDI